MIGYLILVHRYPDQFKRLFRAIYNDQNHYVVHVDKNSGTDLESEIRDFLLPYANAEMIRSEKAIWGGYSLVDTELRGMERLLEMGEWSHFINLSGQDFPLKPQKQIMAYLDANLDREFIKVLDQDQHRPDTMHRVSEYVIELDQSIQRTARSRPFLADATPYIGNQWMIVTRAFCEFVCRDPSVDRFKAFYENTLIADEGFFQTVMMNCVIESEITGDDLRMIDWVADGDIKLRPRTYQRADAVDLKASTNLFARKFDQTVDGEILLVLEQHLAKQAVTNVDTSRAAPAIAPLPFAVERTVA
ncbi:beta-1,6-N-acetylglucosaminyltransferase [Rhizobium sp. P32RR-XVIII]|uniref:beta-1,6-N-acetylglucosaminyltransferase n=1 Tax=Rhizobium sp. P32RR-XVIII TaxID=2726738 RepID=UPI001456D13A|nr:beta-1,6-N-acetylglucosaminyltransferase [Rhizobium sp. P32RR-XVIII]NLS07206.1 beta-1,6-N-acetylglucosaminyltransferase [Rhizobium sp. P32RR-XVIII]